MLQSDNGTEFKNKLLGDYLQKKKIDHIFGSPYHPQSQGSVEVFNRIIQNFLTSAKDALKKNFNLKEYVIEFLHYYNERTHSTTKYKPRERVERAQDHDFIKQVKDNTLKSTTTKRQEREIYIRINRKNI